MKKTLLSLVLLSSLMTLTGCLKGCDKDKKHSETSTDKKEEGKTEEAKIEKNAEMENLKKAALEKKDDIKEGILNNKDEIKDKILDNKDEIKDRILDNKDEIKDRILDNKDEIKDRARNLYKSALMDKRPDEIWLEGEDEELGYGEPRLSQASRYRYGERNSPFV